MSELGSKDAAAKQRIITHMNHDHQDSLVRYLEHFCHLSSSSARHARLSDITYDHLVISTNGHSHVVPIHPSMTSWADARPRAVAMDAEAVAGLKRSNITVKTYVKPTGFMAVVFCVVIFNMTILPRAANFQPGSLLYDNLWIYIPWFARFCLNVRVWVIWILLLVHIPEVVYMERSRLRKHTVPTLSALWWKWILSTSVEGVSAFIRFDQIVEEERKKLKAKH